MSPSGAQSRSNDLSSSSKANKSDPSSTPAVPRKSQPSATTATPECITLSDSEDEEELELLHHLKPTSSKRSISSKIVKAPASASSSLSEPMISAFITPSCGPNEVWVPCVLRTKPSTQQPSGSSSSCFIKASVLLKKKSSPSRPENVIARPQNASSTTTIANSDLSAMNLEQEDGTPDHHPDENTDSEASGNDTSEPERLVDPVAVQESFLKLFHTVSPFATRDPNPPRIQKSIYICNKCDATFTNPYHLNHHLTHSHEPTKPPPNIHKVDASTGKSVCPICSALVDTRVALKHHLLLFHESEHEAERPLKCPDCPKSFSLQINLDLHSLNHSRYAKKFKCPATGCPSKYPTKTGLDVHLAISHKEICDPKTYEKWKEYGVACNICPKTFFNVSLLRSHTVTSHCHDVCDKCGEKFRKKSEFAKHLEFHESQDKDGQSPPAPDPRPTYKCPECEKVFFRKRNMESHIHATHYRAAPGQTFDCEQCGKSFSSPARLTHHKTMHRRSEESRLSGPKRRIKCPKCPSSVLSSYYPNHLRTHQVQMMACPLCHKMLTPAGLKSHNLRNVCRDRIASAVAGAESELQPVGGPKPRKRRNRNRNPKKNTHLAPTEKNDNSNRTIKTRSVIFKLNPKDLTCRICNEEFLQGTYFIMTHFKRNHPGIRPFTCTVEGCEYTANFMQEMERHRFYRHLTREQKEARRTVPCPECPKMFHNVPGYKMVLRNHYRAHRNERSFRCPHCPLGFTTSRYRKSHVTRAHEEPKFPCSHCDSKFTSRASRNNHEVRFHNGTWVCHICQLRFMKDEELQRHLKNHDRFYECVEKEQPSLIMPETEAVHVSSGTVPTSDDPQQQ
jgi:KRAB domain-containing zinc finger protein